MLAVLEATKKQSKSMDWYKYRAGRITALNFKAVCRTSIEKPSLSIIKNICYPVKTNFKSKEITWGLDNEDLARQQYYVIMKSKHANACVKSTGFIISIEKSPFGASPDGLVVCNCCGAGCIEIKCPYRMREEGVHIPQFAEMKNSFIVQSNGRYILDREHSYFYQVQLQMYCTQTSYCDFIVWSPNGIFIEKIQVDKEFLAINLEKAAEFHKIVIKP